ncbi:hypothetical protein ACJX0J_010772 [Zea mays]
MTTPRWIILRLGRISLELNLADLSKHLGHKNITDFYYHISDLLIKPKFSFLSIKLLYEENWKVSSQMIGRAAISIDLMPVSICRWFSFDWSVLYTTSLHIDFVPKKKYKMVIKPIIIAQPHLP